VIFLNPAAGHLTGWSSREAADRSLKEVFRTVPDTSFRTDDLSIAKVVGDGEVVLSDDHMVLLGRDGTARCIEHNTAPIRDSQGKAKGVVITFRDITERRQADQALRQSEERFRQLADHINDVFWIHELEGPKTTYVSPAYGTVWGRSCRSLQERPMSFLEAIHPEDQKLAIRAHQRLKNGEATAEEYRVVHPDGTIRWVWDRGFPIRDQWGRVVRLAGIAEDITERKRAEQALRQSEQRFSLFMQHLPGLAWIKDLQGRYVYANDATERAFQTPQAGLCGKTDDEILPSETAAQFRENDRRALASGTGVQVIETLEQGDGVLHHSLVSKFPILGPDGKALFVGGMAIDITERKRVEEALQDADRRKDEFLAMLGHELRNPLAPIRSSLEMMRESIQKGGEWEQDYEVVEGQVQHLTRLVDDLLDVARINHGKIELRKEEIELSPLLKRVVKTILPEIEERYLELEVLAPAEPTRLEADATRLEQILWNLLSNAAKNTEPGGRIWLTAGIQGYEVVLRIRDTGAGISPEMLPRVFDLFVQGERRHDQPRGGLGIGLSLVKRLVEMHGGSVTAHSEGPGRGSEFTLRLPARGNDQGKACVLRQRPCDSPLPRLRGQRILIVDDNRVAADSLARLLTERYQLQVTVSYDGPSALTAVESFRPQVVLLDLDLPGIDGYEVARILRHRPGTSGIPIVALSGFAPEKDRRLSQAVGIRRHLLKPVDLRTLTEVLVEYVDAEGELLDSGVLIPE
jgi:PAS domain S-box-containing protein